MPAQKVERVTSNLGWPFGLLPDVAAKGDACIRGLQAARPSTAEALDKLPRGQDPGNFRYKGYEHLRPCQVPCRAST